MDLFANKFWTFFLLYAVHCKPECGTGWNRDGYTIPAGDITLEYNNPDSPLNITCVLNNKTNVQCDRSLHFRHNEVDVPSSMVEHGNGSITLFVKKPELAKLDTYSCVCNSTSICMNFVSVGVKPQNVTDFRCISYNYENLTCTWTAPQNNVKTDYTLEFEIIRGSLKFACPKNYMNSSKIGNKTIMTCMWAEYTTPQYRTLYREYTFILTMNNTFGTTNYVTTFDHFSNVLPNAPENLTVVNRTHSSIYLYWQVPDALSHFAISSGLHHRILYQCQYGGKKWKTDAIITHNKNNTIYHNITDLPHAHALCDIRVSMRSAVADSKAEHMWSANSSLTVRTLSRIPDRPPKTNIGSFETEPSTHGVEYGNIYVYWQQIREDERNGPEFTYEIDMLDLDCRSFLLEKTNTYALFKGLRMMQAYTFRIWSKNSEGLSNEYSMVHVPDQNPNYKVKEPTSFRKIDFENGTYKLEWNAPDNELVKNYTIFWCNSEKDRPHQCTGELKWREVGKYEREHYETLRSKDTYQFAISSNTKQNSSGMLWAVCTVIHSKSIGKMRNVYIKQMGSTFIQLGWKLECSDWIDNVEGFIVSYCPIISPTQTNCKEPEKNHTFSKNKNDGKIDNLTPYTTYILRIAGITKHQTYSQQSDALLNTTFEDAPTPPLNLRYANLTNSSLEFIWDPPKAMNGILRFYQIYFNDKQPIKFDNKTITTYKFTNLTAFTLYKFSIQACTVSCSDKSKVIEMKTLMGFPSKAGPLSASFDTKTRIAVVWPKLILPNGKCDYYEVQMTKLYDNGNITLPIQNVTERKFLVEDCANQKVAAFYVSVRAVNVFNSTKQFYGEWSNEFPFYCRGTSGSIMYYIVITIIIFIVGVIGYVSWKLVRLYRKASSVEVTLPKGLNLDQEPIHCFNGKQRDIERELHSPDEQLLLDKLTDNRHLSGDSSGCSSGHESVTSSLGAGTISSADSGTDQIPADAPVDKDLTYSLACEPVAPSSQYVMAGVDTKKTINPGYIPHQPMMQPKPVPKNNGYVVAVVDNNLCKNTGYVAAGFKNYKLD